MRIASKLFALIGLFGLVAGLLFAMGNGNKHGLQGTAILLFFALASGFLALILWRTAKHDSDAYVLLGGGEGDAPAAEEEHGEIHLPGPSIWPAAYGVALFVLLLGLVFSAVALVVGLVLTVLVTVGWALESVRDYRREVAHAKPVSGRVPAPGALAAARALQSFQLEHGPGEAVVQHLGRGSAEIVVVGADGGWGNVAVPSLQAGRDAIEIAGLPARPGWSTDLTKQLSAEPGLWRRMGRENPFMSPSDHHAPRDGATQTGARIFLLLGVFAVFAAVLFAVGNHSKHGLQGTSILAFFGLANFFLAYFLRMAKATHADAAYAGEDGVTAEPTEPAPPVDLATMHLPGPSIWPAAYGIALFVLLLGLVFSAAALIVGLVLTVLVTIGWAVESVREYRATTPGGHGHDSPSTAHH